MQIHIDPLGGWSGDMFVAALLDAFPDSWPAVQESVGRLGLGSPSRCRLVSHRDAALTGRRFIVAAEPGEAETGSLHHHHGELHGRDHHHDDGGDHHHHHDDGGHGEHRAWANIREHIRCAPIDAVAKTHAIGIFTLLAQAEGKVHGVPEEAVTFHEVGAIDSIVDIVAAAVLIARLDATRWTSAPLPLGSGRVKTAHGILPVPAPATALLLEGLRTIDDGIPGERVTPTGAAVARYLLRGGHAPPPQERRLSATGTGFGTRILSGISNCLRVLAFDEAPLDAPAAPTGAFTHRELGVISFEVDDQSGEELAQGLDHIRTLPGIHDVLQSVAFGKKGRLATHVQVLVAPPQLEAAIVACFNETTTIGLRYHVVQGAALTRGFDQVEIQGRRLNVKTVVRPGGQVTGKTEAADVAEQPGHAKRARLRREGESAALARANSGGMTRDAEGEGH